MSMLEMLFAVCAGLLAYHYLVYPAVTLALARRAPRPVLAQVPEAGAADRNTDVALPTVSLIIAAYNEAAIIERKLENSLALDYPRDRIEIIVVADGSRDATAALAQRFADRGVVTLHRTPRAGKTAALNRGVALAKGEIIVFSDANNLFDEQAVRTLVRHFADPAIGGVCGAKQIRQGNERDSTVGDGLYWRFESALKYAQSRRGSVTTADGEIFAVRRTAWVTLDERLINDDAAITFELLRQHYRVRYEPQARSFEDASIRIRDDFHVKVRMVSGGFQTLWHYRRFLFLPPRAFTFAFLSHKLLRWIAPELLILLALSSLLLAGNPLYRAALLLQVAFYALAVIGWFAREKSRLPLLIYVPFYFSAMNAAAFFGLYRYLTATTVWHKAAR